MPGTTKKGSATSTAPPCPGRRARRSALTHLVDTFFDGSSEKVVAALLGSDGGHLSDAELARIADLVSQARKEEDK